MIHRFGGKGFLRLGVSNFYVLRLAFLRFVVSNSYFWVLVFMRLGVNDSFVLG